MASILLNLKVEPGPRCEGGFKRDFFDPSGDKTFDVGEDESLVEFCWEGGKGIADCLLLADVGVADFAECVVNIVEEDSFSCRGGVEDVLCCCCCCCVKDVVLTRGNPMFALTWVSRGPADWRYSFLLAAMVAAVDAIGVVGIVVGREGTGGIDVSEIDTEDELRLCVFFLIDDPILLLSVPD